MNAIAVDDEPLMLHGLAKAIRASKDITSLGEFTSGTEALVYAAAHPVDVAFLDIRIRGMDGLTLAEKLLAQNPDCKIIFCTGYDDYAVDAFRIHASGYLMKPVSAQDVQRELDHILGAGRGLLRVKCFGNFEAYAAKGGEPLHFKRSKTMELLAYLVDRHGSGVTSRQIAVCLWGEDETARYQNYLRQLFLDLRKTLEAVDAEEILEQQGYRYLLRAEKLDCDYYSYLKNGTPPFRGEYMSQYSWAEETCALLTENARHR